MTCVNPGCVGNYDFDNIALFARKKFIEGLSTMELMQKATTEREKEEIALVAMLDLDDETVRDLQLHCLHTEKCKMTNCRELLKKLINEDLTRRPPNKSAVGA